MSCGQVCMYNTLRGCMVDEYGGECPMSNMAYKEQKPMTNAQKIRAMTGEELAENNVRATIERKYVGVYDQYEDMWQTSDGTTFYLLKEAVEYELDWLQQPVKEGADHE